MTMFCNLTLHILAQYFQYTCTKMPCLHHLCTQKGKLLKRMLHLYEILKANISYFYIQYYP